MSSEHNTEPKIHARAFVVGCPRSGTTLLQAMLAAHSRVLSFPETHFYRKSSHGQRRAGLAGLVRARKMDRKALVESLSVVGRPELAGSVSPLKFRFSAYADAFRAALDETTLRCGKNVWIEKTPAHTRFIPLIEKVIPDAQFVHIIRDGRDVVASLKAAIEQDPIAWNWPVDDLEYYARKWNQYVLLSLSHWSNAGHVFVRYEDLVHNPVGELKRICESLGMSFEPSMLQFHNNARQILGNAINKQWRTDVLHGLRDTHLRKYQMLFSEGDKRRIEHVLIGGGRLEHLVPAPLHVGCRVSSEALTRSNRAKRQ